MEQTDLLFGKADDPIAGLKSALHDLDPVRPDFDRCVDTDSSISDQSRNGDQFSSKAGFPGRIVTQADQLDGQPCRCGKFPNPFHGDRVVRIRGDQCQQTAGRPGFALLEIVSSAD